MRGPVRVVAGPPALNYELRLGSCSSVLFWSSMVITLVVIPIALYYPLVYLTELKLDAILGIVSASNGLPILVQLPYRLWQLWKKDNGDRRPLSGRVMDLFMWEYIINALLLLPPYIVSTTIPIPELYLMTPCVFIGSFTLQFFFSLLQLRSPFWLSSLPPGHRIRPGLYYSIEDLIAVDGCGRSAFRTALNVRYEQSPIFRRLLYEMTAYWALGGLVFIGVNAAFTFATSLNFAFAATLIWLPVWACLWLLPAYMWIQRRLKQEAHCYRIENNPTIP